MDTYTCLGRSGLRVSPLCYGCMNVGTEWGFGADQATCVKLMDKYMDAGGNFFDTADLYTGGTSEKWLGEYLASKRSRAVIATKFTGNTEKGNPNGGGNSRKNMVESLDASLKRMGIDAVDLYYVHVWDHRSPAEEVMRGLDSLVRSGKVHYLAVSDTVAWKIAEANTIANLRGWTPFVGLQTQYSLVERTADRDLIPFCEEFGVGIVPWGTLAQGLLTGKYNKMATGEETAKALEKVAAESDRSKHAEAIGVDTKRAKAVLDNWTDTNKAIALEVEKVATELGKSCTQVAINWALRQPCVQSPIIGVRSVEQLDDCLGAVDVAITPEQMERLNKVSAIDVGFPQRWGAGRASMSMGFIDGGCKFAQSRWGYK
mmetsp:Transcript_39484/g.79153  ORF Transcript_39484/g.79153 Transcript_39484/m.79153 type:complete len:373 (-) Transcript_39484:110-1228(-)